MSLLDIRLKKLEEEVGVDVVAGGKQLGGYDQDVRGEDHKKGNQENGGKGGVKGVPAGFGAGAGPGKRMKGRLGRGHPLARVPDADTTLESEIDWGEIEGLLGTFGRGKHVASAGSAQGLGLGPAPELAKGTGLGQEGRPPRRPRTAPAAMVVHSDRISEQDESSHHTDEETKSKEGVVKEVEVGNKAGGEGRGRGRQRQGSSSGAGVLFVDGKPDQRYLFPSNALVQGLGRNSPPKVAPKVRRLLFSWE